MSKLYMIYDILNDKYTITEEFNAGPFILDGKVYNQSIGILNNNIGYQLNQKDFPKVSEALIEFKLKNRNNKLNKI